MPESIAPLREASEAAPGGDIATIPAPENVPEPIKPPEHHETLNNLAQDKELTAAVRSWAARQIEHFRQQPQRVKMMKTGGTMDVADRMMRVRSDR